uniref:WD_REPEATS_REGION domain-containing protein n=1 Tax=Anopheles atroparvus TaxID=41427 RepID=A0A182JB36_ANOAO
MVLTAATTTSAASAIVPAPMTRYDRALPVNAMTEKRYSDRRLRPWPPTYNYGIPGGGGGPAGGGGGGGASGGSSTMVVPMAGGGKSRWMSAGLSDIGPALSPAAAAAVGVFGGLRGAGGSSAGSIYGGSVGGGGQPRYLYAPPGGALKRQNSDFFLNVKSASLAASTGYDFNNNYVVNNIASRKVKNIAGMTAIVDSDSNMEVVRRMSYKYRTKNVLSAGGAPSPSNGHSGKQQQQQQQQQQHHQHQLNNSGVNGTINNLSGGGGSSSRVVSPNQSTSSAPNAHGKQRALRHYTNNFGNNLNGGHSYDAGQQQHQHQQHPTVPTHGKKLLSLKNHRSVDNLLDNVNYSQYYQVNMTIFGNSSKRNQSDQNRPRFVAVTTLEDVQAVRCAEFHPNGRIYAVGSNSKTFRICEYPSLSEIREDHSTYQPTVLFKRTKHHKGSIYCMAWSPAGDLIATGSNDKTVKLMRFSESQKQLEGQEIELTMHDGTVRDLCFLEDSSNKSSLLISGGAGDCKIYVTDCETSTPFQALSGHGGHVLSLYNWGGVMFVSGSQDKTVRFWDLRTRGCVNMVTPATSPGSRQGSPVAAVCVDPSGRLLVSGHEDSSCVLYDIRGNRPIQCFKPHSSDVRSIRFSPSAYYLLTAGYDNKLVLTDLQGDLTMPLPSVVVAQHADKVISGRWHPVDFSFLSTSADKTATLWALPPI